MNRCVPLRRNVAETPRGMRLKFVLSQLRMCTHENKSMFVFFKSLRFYGEQESVEFNPVKLSLCTAAPPLKKIGKELLSDFFEGRGGCTQASNTRWSQF